MHTKSPLNFETSKLETLVDMDLRNVFCSLGYFKTWSLRRSLCRQTSQQASLDRLPYSLAYEMVFKFIQGPALCKSGFNECLLF